MYSEFIKGKTESAPEQARWQSERLDVPERHFLSMLEKDDIICACYSLSRDGKLFANTSCGELGIDRQDGRKFLPDTIFRTYSITKIFTAIAILKLCED